MSEGKLLNDCWKERGHVLLKGYYENVMDKRKVVVQLTNRGGDKRCCMAEGGK